MFFSENFLFRVNLLKRSLLYEYDPLGLFFPGSMGVPLHSLPPPVNIIATNVLPLTYGKNKSYPSQEFFFGWYSRMQFYSLPKYFLNFEF
jgi:hypothetical protein